MKLREIAHSRGGDKEISNLSLIPYNEADYEKLKEKVTAEMVKDHFSELCHGNVTRYEVSWYLRAEFCAGQSLGEKDM